MIVHNVKQGTEEWLRLRLGVPSTSQFGKILTPTGKPSSSVEKYVYSLVGQLISGKLPPQISNYAIDWGNYHEPIAADEYVRLTGRKVKEVGFITSNDGRIGCSPDRLVGKNGLLEIKCPQYEKHSENLCRSVDGVIDMQYYPQIQGQMLMTNRFWCDWMSYHPDFPPVIVRVDRDEEYLAALRDRLDLVIEKIDLITASLEASGVAKAINVKPRVKDWIIDIKDI